MELTKLQKELSLSAEELQVYGIDEDSTMSATANSIRDFYQRLASDFENLLHPENGLSSMLEHGFLSEEDLKTALACYVALIKTLRNYELMRIQNGLVAWIKQSHKEYNTIKIDLIKINQKLLKGWDKDLNQKAVEEYFG